MLLKTSGVRKTVAIILLFVLTFNTVFPSVSFALTSGPAQPEATSFEPVDTSDMVNLLTGDMTYNIPLLEVPGPEGGYPLALSYHAGIQTNADASWVGLGWSLNPGAITRDVNGYPDDYNNIQMTKRDYWAGGSTTTYQFGISVGLAGTPASVNAGLSISSDTYKGFGIGLDAGVGMSYGPLGISANVGINPYGGAFAAVSSSIGTGVPIGSQMGMGVVGSLTLATNFKSLDAGASAGGGISYSSSSKPMTHSLLGASISSNSTKPSLSVGGITASVGNVNSGRIQTSSSGFGIGIPLTPMLGVYLGKKKVRYWSDETLQVYTNGALNMTFPDPINTGWNSGFENHAYDTYHLPDNQYYNMIDYPDARYGLGGSFPDNDYYNVTAQGLGGNIRPYVFQEEVYMQHDKSGNGNNDLIKQMALPTGSGAQYINPQNIGYRFINDFSNSFRQTSKDFVFYNNGFNWIKPVFDNAPIYGKNDGTYGYQPPTQRLAGSKHIEYEWNINLLPGSSSTFTRPVAQGFVRRGATNGGTVLENSFNYQIGGFKITNESGMTYHYTLPAYTGNSYSYTRKKGSDATFNMQTKDGSYAYAWYLTGVTGPDYVDKNNNNIIDEGDWGYWMDFEYGKWCDDYIWRNPETGYQSDLDNDFETQSAGKKEIYYLNKIKTATHSAIFVKSLRNDGKGISSTTSTSQYGNYQLYNGGFDASSKGTLKLDRILIFNNEDANTLNTSASIVSGHYAQNIFDNADIPSSLTPKILRSINFNYDYSLCPTTSNSYDYASITNKTGKLTLTSVDFKGKGGATIMPPVSFSYELGGSDLRSSSATAGTNAQGYILSFSGTQQYVDGEILKFSYSGPLTYCVVTKAYSTYYQVKYIAGNIPPTGTSLAVSNTKNPPYNKDYFDIWNLYKSDFNNADLTSGGENYARITTQVSSKGTDVWSLRQITSSLGNKINIIYEGDSYSESVLEQGYGIQMYIVPDPNYTYNSNENNIVYYKIRNPQIIDRSTLTVGTRFNAILAWMRQFGSLCRNANPTETDVIDTKSLPDCYLEVVDLSKYDTQSLIGFSLHKVFCTGGGIDVCAAGQHEYNVFPMALCQLPAIGNLEYKPTNATRYGGNLRVKSVTIINSSDNSSVSTNYNYNSPVNPSQSSGVTSFEPTVFDDANFCDQLTDPTCQVKYGTPELQKAYKKKLYYYNAQLLPLTRELPPPGVMYKYVTITNAVNNPTETQPRTIEGKTEYEFIVFDTKTVGVKEISKTPVTPIPGRGSNYYTYETRKIALRNFCTRIGNVKRITRYDDKGQKLSETVNNYLDDGLEKSNFEDYSTSYQSRLDLFSQQGVIEENFVNIRGIGVNGSNDVGPQKAINAIREEYPSIMTGQTVTDFKTGIITSSQNLEFDFYSGALTKKVDIDAYGNRILSEVVPAYRKYSTMGIMLNNPFANKNMLTQTAETYSWQVADNNVDKIGLISANVSTWNNTIVVLDKDGIVQGTGNGDVWRPQYSYNWMPVTKTTSGLTAPIDFVDFNWTNPSSPNTNWKKTSEVTKYDTYSRVLEATDINGLYASTKMGYNNTKVVLNGNLGKYEEIAYSGAEDEGIDQTNNVFVKKADGIVATGVGAAHTGAQSLKLGVGGKKGFVYTVSTDKLVPGKWYAASVWVKPVTGTTFDGKLYYEINGVQKAVSATSVKKAGAWTLLTLNIVGTDIPAGATLTVGCRNDHATVELYADDFRFQPRQECSTVAYVYDKFSGELTYTLDNNNLYTRFEYDAGGRLVKTYREKINVGEFKTTEYQYNYGAIPKFINGAINQSFTKVCPAGQVGTSVPISVPAGAFISYSSQNEADNFAFQYAQNQANLSGSCNVTLYYSDSTDYSFIITISSRAPINVATHSVGNHVSLPAGTYDITISSDDPNISGQFKYLVNGQQQISSVDVTFSNVVVQNNFYIIISKN